MHKKKQQLKSTLESVLKKNHTLSYIRQGQNYANNLISERARRAWTLVSNFIILKILP